MKRIISISQLQGVAFALIVLLHAGISWAACPGGMCYVDDNCSPPTDGTSGDPDCMIQDGINRAVNGDSVLVRAGTYASDTSIDFNGLAITVKRETDTILPVITTTGTGAVVKVDFHNAVLQLQRPFYPATWLWTSTSRPSCPTMRGIVCISHHQAMFDRRSL